MRSVQFATLALLTCAACASKQAPLGSLPEADPGKASLSPSTPGQTAAASGQDAGPSASNSEAQQLSNEEGVIAEGQLCQSCHSGELTTNSRIGPPGWTAEVAKMKNWGALVEDSAAAPLAAWLAKRYPAAEPAPPPAEVSPSEASAAVMPEREIHPARGDRQAGAALFEKSCAPCHGLKAEGLGGGPVLIEAPVLYQRCRFTGLIRNGKGRMPASEGVGTSEINNLLAFLRDLR